MANGQARYDETRLQVEEIIALTPGLTLAELGRQLAEQHGVAFWSSFLSAAYDWRSGLRLGELAVAFGAAVILHLQTIDWALLQEDMRLREAAEAEAEAEAKAERAARLPARQRLRTIAVRLG